MKTMMSDVNNILDGKNNRIDTTEKIIGELKDIVMKTIQNKTQREQRPNKFSLKKKQSNSILQGNFNEPNVRITEISKGKERGEKI